MDEIALYQIITGEWNCNLHGAALIFKYDGFHMYKREMGDWVQTYEWSLVKRSDDSDEITGLFLHFLGLSELLLQSYKQNEFLDFTDMLDAHETYHFTPFAG